MEEIGRLLLEFFSDHDVFAWLALGGLGLVLAAFVLGSVGDIGEGLAELKFQRWLRKNDNFARYKTFSDARRGMIREREEREYARATKGLRRRMERRQGIYRPVPMKERLLSWRDGLYSFCDRVADLWDDLASFAARRKDAESPEEKRDGPGKL